MHMVKHTYHESLLHNVLPRISVPRTFGGKEDPTQQLRLHEVRPCAEEPALQDRCTICDVQNHGGRENEE